MLVWREVDGHFNKRTTLVASNPFRFFPPDVSEYAKLREVEGSLYLTPYRFYLSELCRSPHDDDPYRYILIVSSSLHYYVKSIEDDKKVAEIIYNKLIEYYKELDNDPVVP
jgi:hypothetical protein